MFKYVKSVLGISEKAKRIEPTISSPKPIDTQLKEFSPLNDENILTKTEENSTEIKTISGADTYESDEPENVIQDFDEPDEIEEGLSFGSIHESNLADSDLDRTVQIENSENEKDLKREVSQNVLKKFDEADRIANEADVEPIKEYASSDNDLDQTAFAENHEEELLEQNNDDEKITDEEVENYDTDVNIEASSNLSSSVQNPVFIPGNFYSRADVASIVRPDDPPSGGNWTTAYSRIDDNLFIFLNIGIPGTTGHDFENSLDENTSTLTWYTKPNTDARQPLMEKIIFGELTCYFFVRWETRALFTFIGNGKLKAYNNGVKTHQGYTCLKFITNIFSDQLTSPAEQIEPIEEKDTAKLQSYFKRQIFEGSWPMNISLLSLKFDEFSEDEISKFITEEFSVSFVNDEFVGNLDFLKIEIIENIFENKPSEISIYEFQSMLHARFKIRETTEELIRIIEAIETIVKFDETFFIHEKYLEASKADDPIEGNHHVEIAIDEENITEDDGEITAIQHDFVSELKESQIRSLIQVVPEYELSVRLKNVLKAKNLIYFIDVVVLSEAEILRIPNSGRKTLSELKNLLSCYDLQLNMDLNGSDRQEIKNLLRKIAGGGWMEPIQGPVRAIDQLSELQLLGSIKKISYLELSVRSVNILDKLEIETLGELALKRESEIRRIRNSGSKTVKELSDVLKQHDLKFGMDLSGWSAELVSEIIKIKYPSQLDQKSDLDADFKSDYLNFDPAYVISYCVSTLKEREKEILALRFGCGGEAQTLEQVGKIYSITRERIRQIEAKSLVKVLRTLKREFPEYINKSKEPLFYDMAHGEIFIDDEEISSRYLKPHNRLIFELLGGRKNFRNFLSNFAYFYNGCFVLGEENLEAGRNEFEIIKSGFEARNLPEMVFDYESMHPNLVRLLLEKEGYRIYGDLIFKDRVGLRKRRLSNIFSLTRFGKAKYTFHDIHQTYVEQFTDDACSMRDLYIVVDEANALFACKGIEFANYFYSQEEKSFFDKNETITDLDEESENLSRDEDENTQDESTSLSKEVTHLLVDNGPLTVTEAMKIVNESTTIDNNFSYSANSIAPTLSTRSEKFTKVLPTRYYTMVDDNNLDENLDHCIKNFWELLVSADEIHYFLSAIGTGLDINHFPFWRPSLFAQWLSYLNENSRKTQLTALTKIVEPNGKPRDVDIQQIAAEYNAANFSNKVDWDDVRLPRSEVFYLACMHLQAEGSIGLARCNLLMGKKLLSHCGVGLLITLERLGLILPDPTNYWGIARRSVNFDLSIETIKYEYQNNLIFDEDEMMRYLLKNFRSNSQLNATWFFDTDLDMLMGYKLDPHSVESIEDELEEFLLFEDEHID